jgi:RsiW-degrading membrane proteinase PrsW (M82 family)
METLITVLLTLSVTLNVVIMGIFGIAYKQWKKGQQAKSKIDEMFQQWNNK